jgi:hypothetical protein
MARASALAAATVRRAMARIVSGLGSRRRASGPTAYSPNVVPLRPPSQTK